jgi:membrane-associated protease RseP (regulator of RpoE activity)
MRRELSSTDPSRLWVLAGGLAALALLLGLGLRSAGADEPAKKDAKADQPKDQSADKPAAKPAGPDAEQLKKLKEAMAKARKDMEKAQAEMRKAMELYQAEMRKAVEQARRALPGGPFAGRPFGARQDGRLGAYVVPPSATLSDQLGLPKDQGLVLEQIMPESAAAKAGFKTHDVLVEVNGKPVPSDVLELRKLLADVKADKAVDAVVIRKGKRETIKGFKLGERRLGPDAGRPRRPRDLRGPFFRQVVAPLLWGSRSVAAG